MSTNNAGKIGCCSDNEKKKNHALLRCFENFLEESASFQVPLDYRDFFHCPVKFRNSGNETKCFTEWAAESLKLLVT